MKNGGYAIISHDDVNIFNKVDNAYNSGKPILFYDDDKTCFFVDSVKINGDGDYELTKGGKTITITDANTVSSTGSADAPTMEKIKDLAGNLRFIEGDGNTSTISGVSFTYCKWSLSGTHLMFVLAGNIADATAISGQQLASFNLPQWILDKIYPTYNVVVENKTLNMYNEDLSSQSVAVFLQKTTNINIYTSSITTTKERNFRIQFDLLIDAE